MSGINFWPQHLAPVIWLNLASIFSCGRHVRRTLRYYYAPLHASVSDLISEHQAVYSFVATSYAISL